MNKHSQYLIMGGPVGPDKWNIHLHLKKGNTFSLTALCGKVRVDDSSQLRNFANRNEYENPPLYYNDRGTKVSEICADCEKARNDEPAQELFAVAIEELWTDSDGKTAWRPRTPHPIEYIHAKDAAEARVIAGQVNFEREVRIVSVGLAVGFTAQDKDGKVLLA